MRRISHGLANGLVVAANLSLAVQPVFAQDIVAAGNALGPKVVTSANGVPLVMIERPNSAGVSHNQFSRFNVGTEGVVFNNLDANYGMTNLAGYIQGNGNVAGNPASVIISEVTGANRSDLKGYLEVGGARADVIVANPYGITCDGCGFINTDHAVLTTGRPRFDGAGLTGVSVDQGLLEIGSLGADARGVSQFDLIARKVRFAGSVHGERVRVIAGRNDVVFATGQVNPKAQGGTAGPDLAIDSTVFGGMYANKITIVSTERGAGVRAPQTMAAGAGGMHITADGRLVMGRAQSQGGATLRSRSDRVVVQRQVVSREALSIEAKQQLILEADAVVVSNASARLVGGSITQAAGSTVLSGATLSMLSSGGLVMAAGARALSYKDVTAAVGAVDLAPGALIQSGAAGEAGHDLRFKATGPAQIAGARFFATGSLHFDAKALRIGEGTDLPQSGFVAAQDLNLTADDIWIRNAVIQTRNALSVRARTSLTTGLGTGFKSGGALNISAPEAQMTATLIDGGADVAIATPGSLRLSGSSVDALGKARISGGALSIAGVVEGTNAVTIAATQELTTAGQIRSEGTVALGSGAALSSSAVITGASVELASGTAMTVSGGLAAQTGVALDANGALSLAAPIKSAGSVQVTGATVSQSGDVLANGAVALAARSGALEVSGKLTSGGALTLDGATRLGAAGTLLAGADLTLRAGGDLENRATVASDQAIIMDAGGALRNTGGGAVQEGASAQTIQMTGASVENTGDFSAEQSIQIASRSGDVINQGDLTAGQQLTLASGGNLTSDGALISGGALELSAAQAMTLSGSLKAVGALSLAAEALTNDADLGSDGGITLAGQSALTNRGDLRSVGAVTLTSVGALTNAGGLQSGDAIVMTAGGLLTNTGSGLASDGASALRLTMTGAGIQNSGSFQIGEAIALNAEGAGLSSTGQLISQTGAITLSAASAVTTAGSLLAQQAVSVQGTTLNLAAAVQSNDAVSLVASGNLTNTGAIRALRGVDITAGRDLTQSGDLRSGKSVLLKAGRDLTNSGGLFAAELISMDAGGRLENAGSGLEVDHADAARITLKGGSVLQRGTLVAQTDLVIEATSGALSNSGNLGTGGDLTARAVGDLSNSGALTANGNLILDGRNVASSGDLITYGDLSMTARGDLTVSADAFAKGVLSANVGGTMRLASTGAVLAEGGALTLNAGAFDLAGDVTGLSDVAVRATGAAIVSGKIASNASVELSGGRLDVSGSVKALDAITARATAGSARVSGLLHGTNSVALNATGGVTMATGGALLSTLGAVTVSAGGRLQTQSGTRIAGQSVDLSGADMILAGLAEAPGTLKLTSRSGGITSSGVLRSSGLTLNSAAGIANSGKMQGNIGLVAAAALTNSGNILGGVISSRSRTLTNSGTVKGSAVVIKTGAGALNTGRIESTGDLLATIGGTLTNRGRIDAERLAELRVGAMGNTASGRIEAKTLRIFGGGTISNQGTILGLTDVGISTTGGLVNSGQIEGKNRLVVKAGSLRNSGGLTGRNTLTSLAISGAFDNTGGRIHSNGLVDLALPSYRNFTQASWGAIGGETVSLHGAGTAALSSLTVGAGQSLVTGGHLQIQARTLTNAGTIASKSGQLLIKASSALSNTGLLYAADTLVLRSNGAVRNTGGAMLSSGSIVICGANSADCTASFGNDRAGKLINSNGGRIETFGGDILIAAGEIRNETDVGAVTDGVIFNDHDGAPDYTDNSFNRDHWGLCDAQNNCTYGKHGGFSETVADGSPYPWSPRRPISIQFREKIEEVAVSKNGPVSEIISAGNIVLNGGTITNAYALISATKNIHVQASELKNIGVQPGRRYTWGISLATKYAEHGFQQAWGFTGASYDHDATLADFSAMGGVLGRVLNDPINKDSWNVEVLLRIDTEVAIINQFGDKLYFADMEGFIADPDPHVHGWLRSHFRMHRDVKRWGGIYPLSPVFYKSGNGYGTIEAGGAITGSVTGYLENGAVTDHLATRQAAPGLSPTLSAAPFANPALRARTVAAPSSQQIGSVTGVVSSAQQIGSNATFATAAPLSGVTLGSGLGSIGALTDNLFGGGQIDIGALVIPPATPNGANAIDGYDVTSPRFAGIVGVPDLATFSNRQLFKINPNPNASYLIETRAEFIDRDRFISSDYFLGALKLDPEQVQKRLGDSLTETYLIRDQIFDLTGERLLYDGLDEQAQIRAMYDNAIDASRKLNLRAGVALTPSQIASLTEDIIWLEEREVAGQKVLVPQVYLAKSGRGSVSFNGSKITARDIALNVGALINQSGTIEASNSLAINAQNDILNQSGRITAGGALTLTSERGTIANLSGTISGGDVTIAAVDIISRSQTERVVHEHGFADRVLGHASITASGSLSLDAINDIVVAGGTLKAGEDLSVTAGGNITFGALELGSFESYGEGNNRATFAHRSVVGSELTALNGDITISAGHEGAPGNIVFDATQLTASGSIAVDATGNILLGSAQQVDYADIYSKSGGWFRKTVRRNEVLDVANVVTTMNAGEDVSVTAGGNIVSEAAKLHGERGDLQLEATDGDLRITALTDIHAERSYSRKSYLGGLLSFSKSSDSLLADTLGADVAFGDDIDLVAGGDLEITGGRFQAGGAITTDVGGETVLNAGVDTSYSYTESHSNNGFVVKDVTDVRIQQDAVFSSFEAGDGVSFDESSPVTIGLDQGQAAVGPSAQQIMGADVSDPTETIALLPYVLPDATAPPARDPIAALLRDLPKGSGSGGGDAAPAFDFSGSRTDVTIPGAQDGAGFAVYDDLTARDTTVTEQMTLLDHSYHDEQTSLGVLGQLLVSYLTGQIAGMGAFGELGTIQNAVLKTVVSAGLEGVITGDLDLDTLLKDAVFAGATAKIGEVFSLGKELRASGETVLGLSPEAMLNQLGNSAITAGLQSAIYGGDFAEYFKANLRSGVINGVMAGVQEEIGLRAQTDLFDEGDVEHVLLHALTGCAASELLGGKCGAGALSAGASALYAGSLNGETDWQTQQTALLVSGLAAALASGGDVSVAGIATGIGTSAFMNNYLTHTQIGQLSKRLHDCAETGADFASCRATAFKEYLEISEEQNTELADCETEDCRAKHLARIAVAEGAFDALVVNLLTSGDYSGWQLHNLQYSEADQVVTATVFNGALRKEAASTLCSGAVSSCDISVLAKLESFGALTETEQSTLNSERLEIHVEMERRARANIAQKVCSQEMGEDACRIAVDTEIDRQRQLNNRISGAIDIVFGAAEIAGAAYICPTSSGLACSTASLAMTIHGADTSSAGLNMLITGEDALPIGVQLLMRATSLDASQAALAYDLMAIGFELNAVRAIAAEGAEALARQHRYAFNGGHGATNRTGTGADNVATYNPLKAELTAEEIAQGHGFRKHVVNGREFEDLGITERYQYQAHVEHVINNPSDVRYYVDGRTVYLDAETRTVVVRNPNAGESTAFRPAEIDYDDYISTLPKRNEPYIDD